MPGRGRGVNGKQADEEGAETADQHRGDDHQLAEIGEQGGEASSVPVSEGHADDSHGRRDFEHDAQKRALFRKGQGQGEQCDGRECQDTQAKHTPVSYTHLTLPTKA